MIRPTTPEQIERIVCETYGVSMEEIREHQRDSAIEIARHMLIHLLRIELNMRVSHIAKRINRTHSIASPSHEMAPGIILTDRKERDRFEWMRFRIAQLNNNNCMDYWPIAS
jgi:chromosomal replication initiation ATPase DnaA